MKKIQVNHYFLYYYAKHVREYDISFIYGSMNVGPFCENYVIMTFLQYIFFKVQKNREMMNQFHSSWNQKFYQQVAWFDRTKHNSDIHKTDYFDQLRSKRSLLKERLPIIYEVV